jgi:hypothetical protein
MGEHVSVWSCPIFIVAISMTICFPGGSWEAGSGRVWRWRRSNPALFQRSWMHANYCRADGRGICENS